MGGLLNRSSAQGNGKVKKEKRKQRKLDKSFEPDTYFVYDGNENKDPNVDFITKYDVWDTEFDQKQMMNMNDPPGAPSTYSPNYSKNHNNSLTQSWSSYHDANNSFYLINSVRMTPPYNIPYMPNQYNHTQIPNTINNQSKTVISDERPSKKVQFSTSHQQQQTSTLKPLINTQSWHESNIKTSDTFVPTTTKLVPLSNKSSVPQSTTFIPKILSAQTHVEKAIYVGIDYKATLAERGQTIANKRHGKNSEKNHSDRLNSSTDKHGSRSHTNHQRKHRAPTDSPNVSFDIIPSKSFDSLQPKSIDSSQRILTKSLSINKLPQNNEQIPLINKTKSRNHHRHQSLVTNEIKPSQSLENHRQHRRHHQKHLSNELSLNTQSSTRRIENKQENTPVMRIPLSQFNQQHQKQPSVVTPITNITRTRI